MAAIKKKMPVSTTISVENYEIAQKKGYKFSELLAWAIAQKENEDLIIERVDELEKANKKLYQVGEEYRRRLWQLEKTLEEMRK